MFKEKCDKDEYKFEKYYDSDKDKTDDETPDTRYTVNIDIGQILILIIALCGLKMIIMNTMEMGNMRKLIMIE